VDDIIVLKNGIISEYGTFQQLMSNKGHLSFLIGEHVQLIEEEEPEQDFQRVGSSSPISSSMLNENQISNPKNLSLNKKIKTTDENLAVHIENSQLNLIGIEKMRRSPSVEVFERNRLSVVTIDDEVVPDDAEPMKLVLEDQSVDYKQLAVVSYLKAGKGTVITLLLFAFFFLYMVCVLEVVRVYLSFSPDIVLKLNKDFYNFQITGFHNGSLNQRDFILT
jgi:hypothetical protein